MNIAIKQANAIQQAFNSYQEMPQFSDISENLQLIKLGKALGFSQQNWWKREFVRFVEETRDKEFTDPYFIELGDPNLLRINDAQRRLNVTGIWKPKFYGFLNVNYAWAKHDYRTVKLYPHNYLKREVFLNPCLVGKSAHKTDFEYWASVIRWLKTYEVLDVIDSRVERNKASQMLFESKRYENLIAV